MSESNQQTAVTNTDDTSEQPGKTVSEATTGAHDQNDLDALLNEFDSAVKKEVPPADAGKTKSETKPNANLEVLAEKVGAMVEQHEARERAEIERQAKTDIQDAVKKVRGELPANIKDNAVRAWLDARAEDDPRLAKAWAQRRENPAAFERVLQNLSREIAKDFAATADPALSEDKTIVAAAVKGASTKPPADTPPNYGGMNNNQFANECMEKYGFNPLP